jgi:O-antigen chain-terminating methyltransferase
MTDTEGNTRSAALVERLNTSWRLRPSQPFSPSLKHRLSYAVRRAVARLLGPQETFNSEVVQYINEVHTSLEQCAIVLDQVQRYREALAARERRMEALMAAMRTEHEELRTSVGVLQQATHTLFKDLARGGAGAAPALPGSTPGGADATPASALATLSHKYVGFEDAFRGSSDDIRSRLTDYLPIFAGASDVLDIGCGRGEFLGLLRERGVSGRGIDLNGAMVDVCREKGLDATKVDALSYLRGLPEGSLGGLFAAQVVEHLEPAYLTHLLDAAFGALRPGASIVLETINPACWFAFFESYIRDITHVRPLHPDTLKFLLVASGFQRIDIRYSAPYPDHEKLQPVAESERLGDAVETLNANVEKVNRLLFTHLDYAAVGRRP